VTALPAQPRQLTALEFLAWEREQVGKHDWLDGEVYAMAGGTLRHNALGAACIAALTSAFHGRPCRVLSSDQKLAARPGRHFVYADASVVCGARELEPGTTEVLANPSVIVEVLSASTQSYDRGLKWEGYQRLPSLRDYVLVSQSSVRVEHFQRDAELPTSWRYRELGAGETLTLWNGAELAVDALFAGVFELDGEAAESALPR
jgi:Uma2 family endonuclease